MESSDIIGKHISNYGIYCAMDKSKQAFQRPNKIRFNSGISGDRNDCVHFFHQSFLSIVSLYLSLPLINIHPIWDFGFDSGLLSPFLFYLRASSMLFFSIIISIFTLFSIHYSTYKQTQTGANTQIKTYASDKRNAREFWNSFLSSSVSGHYKCICNM